MADKRVAKVARRRAGPRARGGRRGNKLLTRGDVLFIVFTVAVLAVAAWLG